ncbi:MAG: PAS domain-containing protein, partial [Anaerolineales bacterium]
MPGNSLQKSILYSVLLALAIFALEMVTPQGVAESILYVAVVLISLWSAERRVVFGALILCTLLTVAGFFLSPESPEVWKSVANQAFAITAFWIVGLTGLKHLQMDEETHRRYGGLESRVAEHNGELQLTNEQLQAELFQREQLTEALTTERDLLQALMDNIPDTIYFKDTSSRFTRINRAQVNVLGVEAPDQAIGKTDLDFQASDLARSFYEEEQRLVQTGESLINRIEFNPTSDGQPRWLSTTKVPMRDEAGSLIGIVGVSRDIT